LNFFQGFVNETRCHSSVNLQQQQQQQPVGGGGGRKQGTAAGALLLPSLRAIYAAVIFFKISNLKKIVFFN
jgi:hypothetical protein